jgi:hypothetical protein
MYEMVGDLIYKCFNYADPTNIRMVEYLTPAISYIKIRSGAYFNVCDNRRFYK